ncbi:unnamed protein product, partial [Prorocentrum cordatum]
AVRGQGGLRLLPGLVLRPVDVRHHGPGRRPVPVGPPERLRGPGKTLALANTAAGGTMLSASVSMLLEAHEHSGAYDWQILAGLLVGVVFIRASEHLSGGASEDGEDEADVAVLHQAFMDRRHMRKALLIFTVMFCHSAAEGVAVGVAFSKRLDAQFGIFMSLLLAVHNVPEGLAVALVLVPRGVSAPLASLIAILTSVPQPFMAVASFFFVDPTPSPGCSRSAWRSRPAP